MISNNAQPAGMMRYIEINHLSQAKPDISTDSRPSRPTREYSTLAALLLWHACIISQRYAAAITREKRAQSRSSQRSLPPMRYEYGRREGVEQRNERLGRKSLSIFAQL